MTQKWKDDVYAAMKMRGWREQELADAIAERRGLKSMKRDTINKMLRRQHESALVPDVCAILGLKPPMIATPPDADEETRRGIELLMTMTPEAKRAIILLMESYRSRN